MVLDRARVIELAHSAAPEVRIADAQTAEARALRVGARAPQAPNPEVGFQTGPRWKDGNLVVDLIGALTIPIDVSGTPTARSELAEDRVHAAEALATEHRRMSVGAALDEWLVSLGAAERIALAEARAQLDAALYDSTVTRRKAGTIGDLEVQLAAVLRAESIAKLQRARGEQQVSLARLRSRLGLPATTEVVVGGSLDASPAPTLDALLAHLPERSDRLQAIAELAVTTADATLQHRLGVPAPRLTASGGRDGELFARFGLEVPLPLYQRNQTGAAVARAHRDTVEIQRAMVELASEADLRAAYAAHAAALAAYAVLDAAAGATKDAEHLAGRGYELGQSTLPSLILARRETAAAREAHLEARIALARARAVLAVAAGDLR